jgi:hypothetical protein
MSQGGKKVLMIGLKVGFVNPEVETPGRFD